MQNRFKNRSKNKPQTNKTPTISLKWNQKASRTFPENPGNRPRGAQGRSRRPLGSPKDPQGTPQQPKGHPKSPKRSPKGPQMTPKRLQGTPLGYTKASERQQKRHLTDTPKEPKLKIENRCNRHRHSDSTDATLKQHYVENDLGPAECAERFNNSPAQPNLTDLVKKQGSDLILGRHTIYGRNVKKKSPLEKREGSFASVLVTESINSLSIDHFPSVRW